MVVLTQLLGTPGLLSAGQTMAWELSRWRIAFSDGNGRGFDMWLETVREPGPSEATLIVLQCYQPGTRRCFIVELLSTHSFARNI